MPRRGIGSVRGKSDRIGDPSLRDVIVNGDGEPEDKPKDKRDKNPYMAEKGRRAAVEATRAKHDPTFPAGKSPESSLKRRNDRRRINYFAALDDILADIYEKQSASFRIVKALTQMMESRGETTPFEEERFERTCGNLALIEATREIAWLFGLGPEHSDRVTRHMIDKLFGPPGGK